MKNARPNNNAGSSSKGRTEFTAAKNKKQRNLSTGKASARVNKPRGSGKVPMKRRDMNLAAQRDFVLRALRDSSKHTYWMRANGISHSGARVMELRQAGHNIATDR